MTALFDGTCERPFDSPFDGTLSYLAAEDGDVGPVVLTMGTVLDGSVADRWCWLSPEEDEDDMCGLVRVDEEEGEGL